MNNILKQIEIGDVIFFTSNQYSSSNREKFTDVFRKMKEDGTTNSNYEDNLWMCYTGVKYKGIDFTFDREAYEKHIGKKFWISYETMTDMLKCYALYNCGVYIFPTVDNKVTVIKEFITHFGDATYNTSNTSLEVIDDFLAFIATPDEMINEILKQIRVQKPKSSSQRELSHLINYIAIENEISDMYHGEIEDKDFVKWFPVFFWSKVTFIIPLRATEMLLTPYDCLSVQDGKTQIHIRRTMLKKGGKTVYYDVDKDYKEFVYNVPETWTIQCIRKYQELTKQHKRKYLFDHTKYMINNMLSLQAFNLLLAEFTETYLVGNRKYDYARYATGIDEFEVTTAGDSRPIAMANLYFQDVGSEICRQLADHMRITTSAGYYTNVSNTVYCSSIMQLQRKINQEYHELDTLSRAYELDKQRQLLRKQRNVSCLSDRQPLITGDIEDCVREGHLQECLGCRYYYPTEEELKEQLMDRKQRLDAISKEVVDYLADKEKADKNGADFEKIMLDAQTHIRRYKAASDIKAKEMERKWQRHRPTATNC